jgi:hypothetical protein
MTIQPLLKINNQAVISLHAGYKCSHCQDRSNR